MQWCMGVLWLSKVRGYVSLQSCQYNVPTFVWIMLVWGKHHRYHLKNRFKLLWWEKRSFHSSANEIKTLIRGRIRGMASNNLMRSSSLVKSKIYCVIKSSWNYLRYDWPVRVRYNSIKHVDYATRVPYGVIMHAPYVTSFSARNFFNIL